MRELCLAYFRQLDGFIERLVTAAGPNVQVFLASDHGFTGSTEIVTDVSSAELARALAAIGLRG